MQLVSIIGGESAPFQPERSSLVILLVSRESVEACSVGGAVKQLRLLSDDPALVRRFERSVHFLFEGYDHDPREIHQIPEIRCFFSALNAQWRHWGHFLNHDTGALTLAYTLLVDAQPLLQVAGQVGVTIDLDAAEDLTREWENSMRALHQHHGWTAGDSERAIAGFLLAAPR